MIGHATKTAKQSVNGCWTCTYNRLRTYDNIQCWKGHRAVRAAVKQASTYQELKELLSEAENKMMAVMHELDRQYHAVTSPGTPGQGASNKEDSI